MPLNNFSQATIPAISAQHVSMVFGGVYALNDVAFEVMPGAVHCLAGENDCRKSTPIKIITGVYVPKPGVEMEFLAESVTSVSSNIARRYGVAVIWPELALFPGMTVAKNIAFGTLLGIAPHLANYRKLRKRSAAAMSALGEVIDLDLRLKTLPISQRRIVAITRTLVGDARLIFMDEQTTSLTQSEADSLLGVVRTLAAQGVSAAFVSHCLVEVLEIANRATVPRDSHLVGIYEVEGMPSSRQTKLMTGKALATKVVARDKSGTAPVLEMVGLTRTGEFEDMARPNDLDNLVQALLDWPGGGRVLVGIAGAPGSGKSALARILIAYLEKARPDCAALVEMDGYHYDDRVLEALGRYTHKGAADTFDVRGLKHMLSRLRQDTEDIIAVPVFDRSLEIARAAAKLIWPGRRIIVVEGNYLLLDRPPWCGIADMFDLTVMITARDETLRDRLTRRWQGYGLTAGKIRRKLEKNDLPNGRLVAKMSVAADFVLATEELML